MKHIALLSVLLLIASSVGTANAQNASSAVTRATTDATTRAVSDAVGGATQDALKPQYKPYVSEKPKTPAKKDLHVPKKHSR